MYITIAAASMYPGCLVALKIRTTTTTIIDGSEYPQTVLKLSFGTTKMAAYANKIFIRLFVTKQYGLVLFICFCMKLVIIDIIHSI